MSNVFEVIYHNRGIDPCLIKPDDICTRSGSFVKLIKHFFFDNNSNLLPKKYIESNTYSKTLKLGVKLKYIDDPNKRSIHYINLKSSLEAIRNELGYFDTFPSSRTVSSADQEVYERDVSASSSCRRIDSKRQRTSTSSSQANPDTLLSFENSQISQSTSNPEPSSVGLNNLEAYVNEIEFDIGDILNKLDLLKAEDYIN